jgi:hypothetical protein
MAANTSGVAAAALLLIRFQKHLELKHVGFVPNRWNRIFGANDGGAINEKDVHGFRGGCGLVRRNRFRGGSRCQSERNEGVGISGCRFA